MGLERRSTIPPLEGVDRQSMSVDFARQLYKTATGLTADTQTYIEFRDRLFKGSKRVFDFVDIGEESKRLGRRTLTGLRETIEKSDKVILLGKGVARRISREDVPPERRIEMELPSRTKNKEQFGAGDVIMASDAGLWELIVHLALELS